jgi:hypothetical protein
MINLAKKTPPGHMHKWITTRCEQASLAVRFVHGLAIVIVTTILFGANALSQSDSAGHGMLANELARKVVNNELKFHNEDQSHWLYQLEKEKAGKKQTQEILETNGGSLSRLLSMEGRPLDAKQQRQENQRVQRLVGHPDEQLKLQQASNKNAERGACLFKLLPDVFMFAYAGRQGNIVTLAFRPNPDFKPSSIEARVLYSMQGEMTVDAKQERLVALNGHLMEDVKFGGGLFGHLDKGGKFEVRQAEVAPGHWKVTVLDVDIKGKAFLLKVIEVKETEKHIDFHPVPNGLTLAEAAAILDGQIVVAANR